MSETALLNLFAWSVQAGILAVAAVVITRLVHIDAPAVRYAWWRTVLVVCLALPLIQPWQPAGLQAAGSVAVETAIPAPAVEAAAAVGATAPSGATPSATPPRWPAIVAAALVTGALLRLAWLGLGLVRLRRLRRAGLPADPADGPDLLQALTDAGAELRYVSSLRQPVTFGVGHPVVLLPDVLRTLSPGVQRAVLAHELWHVRRRDWLWCLGEEVLRAILWFHPAILHLVSRVQSAREEVVDELSILSTNARRSYLEALLTFADEPAIYPAAPFARRRQLFDRMLLISREAVMSSKRIVASSAGMAGVLIITGWYGVLAFPLTATGTALVPAASQAQPRDPRPGVPRPATAREQELQAATAADPSNVTNWVELARLQETRGAIAEAEATFKSGIQATNAAPELLNATVRFFNGIGQFDKAVAALEEVAARNPGDPRGHQLVATYYWEKAQKDQTLTPAEKLHYLDAGIAAADRALAQRSDYVEALTYKNILLRMKGNLETDPGRRDQLLASADELRGRAMELQKRQIASGAVSRSPQAGPPPPPPPPPPAASDYEVDGQQPLRIGGEIPTPPKLRDVRPIYPPVALDARVSGVVILEAVIDTAGAVRSARVLRSIPLLDQAAIDAVRQWQFKPTVKDGIPIPVIMTVTVNFAVQ